MAKISGSFSGRARVQASVTVADAENHDLSLVEVAGSQKTSDPLWNDAQIIYWGTADLLAGTGPQRGYWVNNRASGDRDWGTFEGRITASGQQITMEGTFKWTGGTGKFKGISGGGKYKGRFLSPIEVVNDWDGEYQLASARAAG
jgi:hypothetical protein